MSIDAIKTWQERCEENPDHNGIVTNRMIQARMQEEIDDLRAAIEQAQEPVAWMCADDQMVHRGYSRFSPTCAGDWNIPVYTAPRQWQGLTKEEVDDWQLPDRPTVFEFAQFVEAKLKERNG